MPTHIISPGTSIQTTINTSSSGDTILLNPGTYTSDTLLVINKPLTIAWNTPSYITYDGVTHFATPGSQPVVNLNGSEFQYLIDIQANNVSISGLAFNNIAGGGVNMGYVFSSVTISNLTISFCDFGFFRRILFENIVTGINFTNNTVHDTRDSAIELDSGVTSANISYNQFWNETYNYHGEGAINMFYPAAVGTCVIQGNYVCTYRGGIAVQPQGADYPTSGTILIANNTIDMAMATYHEDPTVFDTTLFGINLFCNTSESLNGALFTVKNNLVTRCKSYGVYLGQTGTQNNVAASLTLTTNMFYDCSWFCNASAPSSALVRPIGEPVAAYQYPEPTGQNGSWGSGGAGDMPGDSANCLIDNGNIFGRQPRYAETGTYPAQYYALMNFSAAANAAAGGGNIGAWQGTVSSENAIQYVPGYAALNWASAVNLPIVQNKL